jgi:hypothetical protein
MDLPGQLIKRRRWHSCRPIPKGWATDDRWRSVDGMIMGASVTLIQIVFGDRMSLWEIGCAAATEGPCRLR